MNCKQGEIDSIEYYRVLGIFSKYHNKWFAHIDSDKLFGRNIARSKRFLQGVIQKDNVQFKEVQLKNSGTEVKKCAFFQEHF